MRTVDVPRPSVQPDGLPTLRNQHLAHPNPDAPWVPTHTLCGYRIRVGMSYREVPYAAMNPNPEGCARCDFAVFVEQQEARHLPVGSLIERVA